MIPCKCDGFSIMHASLIHSAAAAAFGLLVTLVATPASAQCDPFVCSNPYSPNGPFGELWLKRLPAEPLCLFDPVVWVNTKSRVYHVAGSRTYGHTRYGGYMCETEAKSAGYQAAPR
jgi:hypothetical protein